MISSLNPAYSDGASGAGLLKLFGVQTPQASNAASSSNTAHTAPGVSADSKTPASSQTIQAILEAAAAEKNAGAARTIAGVQSTYADGTWDGFVQYGPVSTNSVAADTTTMPGGSTITVGHNPPVQLRDPGYQNNYTLAQAQHNFYMEYSNGAYVTLHSIMTTPGENVAAFDKAFHNKTLTFTPTSQIKDLQLSYTTTNHYNSSGQIDGGGSTLSWSGGTSIKGNPNEFLTGNYGYKGSGDTSGFLISW